MPFGGLNCNPSNTEALTGGLNFTSTNSGAFWGLNRNPSNSGVLVRGLNRILLQIQEPFGGLNGNPSNSVAFWGLNRNPSSSGLLVRGLDRTSNSRAFWGFESQSFKFRCLLGVLIVILQIWGPWRGV